MWPRTEESGRPPGDGVHTAHRRACPTPGAKMGDLGPCGDLCFRTNFLSFVITHPPQPRCWGSGPGPAPRQLAGFFPATESGAAPRKRSLSSGQRCVPDGKESSGDSQGGRPVPGAPASDRGTHSTRWGSRPPAATACGRRAAGRARGTPASRACSSGRCPSRLFAARCPSSAASGSRRSRCCGKHGRRVSPTRGRRARVGMGGLQAWEREAQRQDPRLPAPPTQGGLAVSGKVHLFRFWQQPHHTA